MELTTRGNRRVTNEELRRWVRAARKSGKPSAELCEAIQRIARGVREHFHRQSETDDFVSDCVVKILETLPRVDLAKNVFGYFTNVCINLARNQHGRTEREKRKLERYAAHLAQHQPIEEQ
jgi:DNA-directed RNA polymerase specialized sigma24 family protein